MNRNKQFYKKTPILFIEPIQQNKGHELSVLYKQLAGEDARKAFDQVLSVSAEDKAWVLKWIKDKYDVDVK
jgi:hypothetical protein